MDRQHREAEWGRIHSSNGTMRRSNVPPRLTLSSPKSERSYNLDPSSIMSPQRSLFPQTAPLEGRGPDLRLHPATVTTPNFPEGSMTSLSRVSTKSSYESFSFRDRSGSSETAKGVAAKPAEETTIDTLSGQRSAVGDERVPLRRDYSPFTQAGRTYGSLAGRRVPSSSASVMLSSTRRRMHSSIMHGVVLAIQGSMTLAVFSALIWVTIWQKDDSDLEFWDW